MARADFANKPPIPSTVQESMSEIEVGGNLYVAEVRTCTNSSSNILEKCGSILKLENK